MSAGFIVTKPNGDCEHASDATIAVGIATRFVGLLPIDIRDAVEALEAGKEVQFNGLTKAITVYIESAA